MAGTDDYIMGNDGQWYSPEAEPPPGVTLNKAGPHWNNPQFPRTQTAEPSIANGFAQPEAAPTGNLPARIINTPNSSTGTPFRLDPSASSIDPQLQGKPGTLTASSRHGFPAPGIRNAPSSLWGEGVDAALGGASRVAAGAQGLGILALPALQGSHSTAEIPAEIAQDDENRRQLQSGWQNMKSFFGWGDSQPVTQAEGGGKAAVPPPPPGSPPPPYRPEDDPRAAIPPMQPQAVIPPFDIHAPPAAAAPLPPPRPKDRGHGRAAPPPGVRSAPPMMNLQPQPGWTTIDRPNADIAGGRSVAGQLAPQYFNKAREPGGPAQMGAFDFSTLFNHPQVAAQAAAQPAVRAHVAAQAAAAPRRRPVRGPLAPGALGGSGSPTPMDIQDQTRGRGMIPGSGSPTPMDIQDRTRGRDISQLWPQGFS